MTITIATRRRCICIDIVRNYYNNEDRDELVAYSINPYIPFEFNSLKELKAQPSVLLSRGKELPHEPPANHRTLLPLPSPARLGSRA